MQILVFSDIYTTETIPEAKPDLVVLLGRIPSKMVSKIDKMYDCTKVGLLSNKCHPTLYQDTNIVNLHERVIEVNGIRFAGFGGVPLRDSVDEGKEGYFTEQTATQFIDQLAVSNVEVLLTYSNLAYGDVPTTNAENGFKAFNQLVFSDVVKTVIHGRLSYPFEREIGKLKVHSVYPYSLITI